MFQVLFIIVNKIYIKIVGNWANYYKHKIIILSITEQYQVAFEC